MSEIERLETELNKLTIGKAKAESVLEQTQAAWVKDYETDNADEIGKIRDNLAARLKKANTERQEKIDIASKLLGLA